jgi:hypothetical protein
VAAAGAIGVGRMSMWRHRISHVLAPAKALADAAAKGREVADQRAKALGAAEAGDPAAYLALSAIVDGLRRVDNRLERVGAAAEQHGQRIAVASLAGQQLRVVETRAKLGNVGGYGAARASSDGASAPRFQVTIVLDGKTDTITAIDGSLAPEADVGCA